MSYPTIVYKCPGTHQRPGGTFAYKGVASEAEHIEAMDAGWFDTMLEAIAGKPAKEQPPTRAELEQKAAQLGIHVDKKVTDAVLTEKIAKALVP